MDHQEYKEHLFTQIVSSADVHAQKAKKNPDDKRFAQSEKSLNALAESLKRVPATDPFFMRACNLRSGGMTGMDLNDEEVARMSNAETEFILQYGLRAKASSNPDQFLRGLVDKLTQMAVIAR